MNKIKLIAKSIGYSWNLILQSSRYMIFLYFALMITTSFPLLSAFLLKYVLDVLTSNAQETGMLWIVIIIYGMSLVVNQGISSAKYVVRSCINQKAQQLYECRLAEKLAALPMEILDSSEGRDLIDEVRYTESAAVYMTFQVADVISQAYTFAIAFTVLAVFSPGFSLMFLVFTIFGMICNEYYVRKSDELRAKMAPDVRKFCYYRWMLTDAWPAKDVRMYDLTDSIRKRYHEEKADYLRTNRKLGKKALSGRLFIELLRRSGEIVFITYVVFSALDGRIGIGDVALYIGFANTIANSLLITAGFVRISKLMEKLFDFFSIKTEQKQGNRKLDTFISLAFDNVYFKYPHTETYVLSGVSFTVNKGDKLPIVGINGSGKSTIIKLMFRFYDPEEGCIRLGRYYADNGKDLSGGQWQLAGLARAYFRDSEYLILDEPSAALDPISEDRIFEQLYHLSEGKSSVTISHRLSNTTLADKILVIGDGHIIEQGSHDALLKQNGKYAQLFRLQASKYI